MWYILLIHRRIHRERRNNAQVVQSVSAMEAKIEGMSDNLSELKSDIALLKQSQMDESRENTKFMKLTWVALGACVGAGGTEAVKAFIVAMRGM